jgi:hypothetical protein
LVEYEDGESSSPDEKASVEQIKSKLFGSKAEAAQGVEQMAEILSPYNDAELTPLDLALLRGIYRCHDPPSQVSKGEPGPDDILASWVEPP